METLKLNVFGTEISWDGVDRYSGRITSDMNQKALETLILAHFSAGLDVTEPGYLEGIEAAYLTLANQEENLKAGVIAEDAVASMGDIFYEPSEGEEIDEKPLDNAKRCIQEAIERAANNTVINQ